MGFTEDINKFADKAEKTLDQVARSAAIELFKNIVKRTPVDTGRARANWQPEFNGNAPNASLNEKDKTGQATCAKIAAKFGGQSLKGQTKIGIYNNLTYIEALEHGHSKLRPHGMARVSALEFPDLVKAFAGAS